MANAQVEMLKALGLRHGEKAVVALAGTLCFLFLVVAVTRPTIDVTPEEVDKHASSARQNLERKQDPEKILARIESDGIKNPGFEKLVDNQSKNVLVPDTFKAARLWVTTEPGAGRIRDTPVLVAATDLYAYPGRGGAAVFELDESGDRILVKEDPKKVDEGVSKRRKRKRQRNRGMAGMMGMGGSRMMGAMMGGGGRPPGEMTEKEKKEAERQAKQRKAMLAGKEGDKKEETKEDTSKEGTPKEITRGLRWVVITGVLDHKQMKANYLAALKRADVAHPHYKQLNVERQAREPDGSWPDKWEAVDIKKNQEISFNLPEEEEELAPDDVILDGLVDPLPFLKAGYWEKVHVVSLVPKEKREIDKSQTAGGFMGGGMRGGSEMAGPMGGRGMMMGGGGAGMGGGMAGMRLGSSEGRMGMTGGTGGGSAEIVDWEKSEAETVMIRSLDYTVEPDTTYRFRLQVVVFNPNFNHEDVSPGVNTKDLELKGPWSEPTNEVTMPADVTPYAMDKEPANPKRSDQISFQVVRWDPENGVTVTRNYSAGPGDIIGDIGSASIPTSDGSGAKNNKTVNFISRLVVLDAAGGPAPIAQVGASGAPLDVPALTLLMRPDGSVLVRNETYDRPDTVRKDIDANYKREVKESTKRRERSLGGMSMPGMAGGGR